MIWRAPDISPEVWQRDQATDHPNPKVYAIRAGTEVHVPRLVDTRGRVCGFVVAPP